MTEKDKTTQLGLIASILMTILTTLSFVIAVLTPPLSGPYAVGTSFQYPFIEAVSRFPRDYYWIYTAMLMIIAFLVTMVCIHDYAARDKKVFSQIGLCFALLAAAILLVDYFLQVSVIQPSLLNGEQDGIAILTQYNPHGIFIALEELGYLLMSLAFFCMVPVFSKPDRVEMAIRWLFKAGLMLSLAGLAVISSRYGIYREYRFEVLVISLSWTVLIIAGVLLSIVFRRAMPGR